MNSPRTFKEVLSFDKIYNLVNYSLKEKEKISLKDINDIEKKIDNAYARIIFNHNTAANKDRSANESRHDAESPERGAMNKTQALQDFYRSRSPARVN